MRIGHWREGLSATAVGRFGGMLYNRPIGEAVYRDAPVERLLSLVRLQDLAADMLMVYQQATHPRLLIPANAEFGGCVWDEAARTLTVRLAPLPGRTPDNLILLGESAPQAVVGAAPVENTMTPQSRAYRLAREATEVRFQFQPMPEPVAAGKSA